MHDAALTDSLREAAREADSLHRRSRRLLRNSVRMGADAGLSQREIAEAIGRSQPEVSRLLRFHGETALARRIEHARGDLLRTIRDSGGRHVRVFGSLSRGDDHPDSDLDLLVDFAEAPSLFELARLETALSKIAGTSVDVVSTASLRPNVASRALAESVPL